MLPNYAKWYGFTPPHWPNFPPPLTEVILSELLWVVTTIPPTSMGSRIFPCSSFRPILTLTDAPGGGYIVPS